MGCGCRGNNKTSRGTSPSGGGDLTKFAFLSPRQLKIRQKQLEEQKKIEEQQNTDKEGD